MECVVPINMTQQVEGKAAGPCIFVVFDASGDLAKRKLFPALFNLVKDKLLTSLLCRRRRRNEAMDR